MAESYSLPIQLRWSDLDPNFHLRHSVYYDFGAMCRMQFFSENGMTPEHFAASRVGPILFREEAVFRREVSYGDQTAIDIQLVKCRADYSRWTISHRILKNGSILCVQLSVDGAWLNTESRKLAVPPPESARVFEQLPRSADFAWIN